MFFVKEFLNNKIMLTKYQDNGASIEKNKLILEIYPNLFKQNDGNRPIIEQKLSLKKENKYLIFGTSAQLSNHESQMKKCLSRCDLRLKAE